MWTACAAGTNQADCRGGSKLSLRQNEAVDHCENLNWSGLDDWRLPSHTEAMRVFHQDSHDNRVGLLYSFPDYQMFPYHGFASFWVNNILTNQSTDESFPMNMSGRQVTFSNTNPFFCVRDL